MKPHLIVVGIGNPGKQYQNTRHNLGFLALQEIANKFGTGEWKDSPKYLARTCEARILAAAVLLVEPQTFMNRSGECVRKLVDFYKVEPSQVLVITDDIDLPLAEVRLRPSGGPGTHNGLRSVVATIGEGFPRMRIGLGEHPSGEELANWVLSVPPEAEREAITKALRTVPERLRAFVMERAES